MPHIDVVAFIDSQKKASLETSSGTPGSIVLDLIFSKAFFHLIVVLPIDLAPLRDVVTFTTLVLLLRFTVVEVGAGSSPRIWSTYITYRMVTCMACL